ncbi:MAG TPA: VWA domain-containing protein [Pyrinomonadaceae bacterium]|nr:VWA domain-containing protein [Pyrinomonadaceae bacterium]
MKKALALAFAAGLALLPLGPVTAQQQPPPPSPRAPVPGRPLTPRPFSQEEPDEDDVVRITSNLVQFDAVVTDKQGRQVTDLKPEEFEVLVNDKPQEITHLSYNSNESRPTPAPPTEKNPVAAPPVRLRPEQVRRTIAVVVDDQRMSWTSLYRVRRDLKKFVNEQMQPGDFVAVIRTQGGTGFLQQFTSDKRLLLAAVESLRWNFGAGTEPWERIEAPEYESIAGAKETIDGLIQYRAQFGGRSVTGTLMDVIRGLGELPGRKSLMLISEGVYVPPDATGAERDIWAGLNRVIEEANRASVLVYTIDSRPIPNFGPSAADNLTGHDVASAASLARARASRYFESQRGMVLLAEETGGLAFDHSNDLGANVRRVLEDQKGFYLVGFRPDESAFDGDRLRPRFNKLTVKVKRKGVRVRTRTGFFGYTGGRRARPVPLTRVHQIREALNSPFASAGVRLRLTALFGSDRKRGPFVRSILHIDGRDLTFTQEAEGWHRAVFDVVAVTQGADGRVLDEVNRTHTVRVREDRRQQILAGGLVYSLLVPVKKPGAYQLRTAVRDEPTRRVGSANQLVEVPDLKKNRLALSGILMTGREATMTMQAASRPDAEEGEQPTPAADASSTAAVRRFRQGALVDYAFNIHNARLDPASGRPRLETRLRLFREGKQILDGEPRLFDAPPQTAAGDLGAGGRLRLAPELPPGEYVLQIVVTDLLAKEKHRTTSQWIDFDIVK